MSANDKVIFINKTVRSKKLSRSEGVERSRIFSHVQRGPQKPSPKALEGSDCSSNEQSAKLGTTKSVVQSRGSSPSSGTSSRPSHQTADARSQNSNASPHTQSTLGLTPFSDATNSLLKGTAGFMNPYMQVLLDFYETPLISRVHPTQNSIATSRQETIGYALQNPALMASLLCAVASSMYCATEEPRHMTSSIHFKGRAICHLKELLNEMPLEHALLPTLYAVSILVWSECLRGSINDMQAHIEGLKYLVPHLHAAGFGYSPAAMMILASSSLYAAMTDTAPQLKPPPSTPVLFHRHTLEAIRACTIPAISKMGTCFFDESKKRLLTPQLLNLITQQCQYISFNSLCAMGGLDPADQDSDAAASLQMMVEYELLSLPFEGSRLRRLPYSDAIRLALFVFGQPICTIINPTSSFARSVSAQLRRKLETASCTLRRKANRDLSIWLLFITAYVSYGQQDCVWAIGILSELVSEEQIETVEQFEELLCGFYCIDMWFRGTVKKVWDDVKIVHSAREGHALRLKS